MISIPVLLGLFGTSAAVVAYNEHQTTTGRAAMSVTLNNAIQKMPPIPRFLGTPRNLVGFSSSDTLGDTGVTVNNEYVGPSVLWTSDKCNAQFVHRAYPAVENDIAVMTSNGSVKDSGFRVDDNALADPAVLWSSRKIYRTLPAVVINDNIIDSYRTWSSDKLVMEITNTANSLQAKASPEAQGNVAIFDDTGTASDSGVLLSDSETPSYNVLWSSKKMLESIPALTNVDNSQIGQNLWDSSKINNEILTLSSSVQHLGNPASATHIPVFDSMGALVDGQFKMDDSALSAPNILWSSQKLMSTIPALNDANVSTTSTWSSSNITQNLLSKVDKVPGFTNNLASFTIDGDVQSSGFIVDDTKTDLSSLWTSSKISQMTDMNYQKKAVPVTMNSIAILDDSGQVDDSGVIINDNVIADIDVLWSSKKISDSFLPISLVLNKNPNFLLNFDGSGNVASQFQVNDAAAADPTVIWSSDKILSLRQTDTYASAYGSVTLNNLSITLLTSPSLTLGIRAAITPTNIISMAKQLQYSFKRATTPIDTLTYIPIVEGFSLTAGDDIEGYVFDITNNVVYRVLIVCPTDTGAGSFLSIEQL
jgi:hypothetical protein